MDLKKGVVLQHDPEKGHISMGNIDQRILKW